MADEFQKDASGDGYEEYEPYSPLRKKSPLDKTALLYIAIGIGVLVLVLAFFSFRPGPGGDKTASRVDELERRLDDLEFRIAEAETFRGRLDMLESRSGAPSDLDQRIARIEQSIADHLNQLDAKLAAVEKKIAERAAATPPPPKTEAPKPKPAAKAPETKAAPKARYHMVQAGETLFAISRKYNTTVERLRQLNGIDASAAIRPGQKIRVSD